jgi:hypothetical protein
MNKIAMVVMAMLCIISANAKTYTLDSGKWTDPKVWGNEYIGAIIKAGDTVVITGQITLTTPLVVEGRLQVEQGASIVGMKDLYVAKGGIFENRGNTVVRSITNQGTINNYLAMEAMNNIETDGHMLNNSYMLAGHDFESKGGSASGNGGRIYANNTATVSASTKMRLGVSILSAREKE